MSDQLEIHTLSLEDQRLIELVDSVLTDPNVHTDSGMRLHEQIATLLDDTAPQSHSRSAARAPARTDATPVEPDDPRVSELLRSVLVDPNLHTDLRMRLHEEIPALIRAHRS